MIADIIITLIIIFLVASASSYIYKAKKRGQACIGCPHCKQCKRHKH